MNLISVRRGALCVAGMAAAALSACTTYVDTQVTAFSAWSGSGARTYAFAHPDKQPVSLEDQTYELEVDGALDKLGFHNVPAPQARYLVALRYDVVPQQVTVQQPVYPPDPWMYRRPGFGPWGAWGPWGPWGPWSPWGPDYVNTTYPVFDMMLGISIAERASGREVYKVSALTRADQPSLVRAMPYLVHAALGDFPLANGETRVVRVPLAKPGAPEGASAAAAAPAGAQQAKPAQ